MCITWEDIDVNYSESVCVYVDDDVHAKQGHVKLNTELFDKGSEALVAGRRQARHLLIQLTKGEKAFLVKVSSSVSKCFIGPIFTLYIYLYIYF